MAYVCIGVPYYIGKRQKNGAVEAMRASGIAAELGAEWVEIEPAFGSIVERVSSVNEALVQAITSYPDHTPLIFAADCVSAVGAVKGLELKRKGAARPPLSVLWYDAHGDFNTEETTPSNFLGGMPLAALVGRGSEWMMQDVGLKPLAESDVIITDARDLDPEEGVNLAASGLTHLKDVADLLSYPLPSKPLYVHFDTDVVNTDDMPAMSYPAKGGPSLATTISTLERVKRDADVVGVLFSLWGQDNPGADVALQNCLKVVRAFAG